MCISNTETCADWRPFATSHPWVLSDGDGLKTVHAWFRDGVENSNSLPYVVSILLDATAPDLSLSTLSNGAYTNNPTINLSGTVSDSGTGVKQVSINGTDVLTDVEGAFNQAMPLAPGANSVTVIATDFAQNQTVESRTITYDPKAPLLTILEPADNSRTNKAFIDVTGTVDKESVVELKVNTAAPEMASVSENAFIYTANLVVGANTIEVTATDLASNTSTAKRTVNYDNMGPSLAITDPAQDITTSQGNIVLKGSVADDFSAVTVTVAVDGQMFTPTVVNGSFEQSVTFATAKSYVITVTAFDEAGNSTSVQRNIIYVPKAWKDVSAKTSVTKSGTLFDRVNNCYYLNISVKNTGTESLSGPIRMIIANSTIPVKSNVGIGLKPDGYTVKGEAYFNIVSPTGLITPGGSINNLRVNFEMMRISLTFGVRIEKLE